MQLRWLALSVFAASAVFSNAPTANAISLLPMEEPATQLVSPSSSITAMQYALVGSTYVQEPITSTPLLCGNTSAPASPYTAVSPTYYSPNGIASLRPFVFGASSVTPTVQAFAQGASIVYGSMMRIIGDPSLVCYGLDANGVHGPTPGVMRDQFEGVNYSPTQKISFNSSVALSVFHVPTSPTDYYGYTIDVTIPQLPAGYASMCLPPVGTGTAPTGIDCNFALTEGFDTSVFDASAGLATSGQWCLAPAGVQSCASPPPAGGTTPAFGDININYSNYVTTGISLGASIAPAAAKQFHFVAYRKFASGVTNLPASGGPVVIAALFSPFDLDENFIGDNVAVGTNQLANTAPAVVTTGDAWTTFSNKLGSLAENTDSNTLSFNATDADTQGAMTASVTLNLPGGISVAVPGTNCSATTPPSGQLAAANCTLDIPLNNATWWNASVASGYQGLFNALATDASNGSYASGVSASALVVVSDALGKPSAPVTVPIHIYSSVNNAPVVSYSGPFAMATDPQNNHVYPTLSCSVSLGSGAGGCGAVDRYGLIEVDAFGSITALPGPAAAFDELATQGTKVVNYSDPLDTLTNVQCNREQQAQIFATNGGPIVVLSSGSSGTTLYDMNFVIPSTPPASAVSAVCTLTMTDVGPFPNGESAATSASSFRLVVNP